MKKIYLYIALSLLILTGCEKSGVVDSEIPYEEFIVVQSELKSEKLFDGVKFTRTLPPGIEYTLQEAELKDVTAYIRIDSLQIIPLHYTSAGLYNTLYELKIEQGRTYELFGERGGRRFYASTTIPFTPFARSVSYNSHTNSFDVVLTPKPKEIYGAVWIIGNYQDMSPNYSSLSAPGEVQESITISTSVLPEKYRTSGWLKYIKLYSYDPQFYNFYNSIKNNEPVNNVFLQGSGSISWNVTGNNVIGLFIGSAEGELKYAP